MPTGRGSSYSRTPLDCLVDIYEMGVVAGIPLNIRGQVRLSLLEAVSSISDFIGYDR